ncbi:MAG: ribbon-helix-helix domain-containing protein [Candidatus Diapherotrites archaeon]
MKQYNLVIEHRLIKEVDALVKKHGLYSSRSDFIRDAIRTRLIELKKVIAEDAAAEAEEHDEGFAEAAKAPLPVHDEHKFRGVH